MAGIFNGPPRGGTRGGRDQFNWENVRADKDREYYLGHSVKALAGRWQKNKDVYWYTREVDGEGQDAVAKELAAVKQREQDLMMEALGVKPKAPKAVGQARLDKADMQKLLQGGGDEEEDTVAAKAAIEADRVKGLGFHASMTAGAIQGGELQETLAGMGPGPGSRGQPSSAPAGAGMWQQQQQQQQGEFGGTGRGLPGGAGLSAGQIAEVKRLARKEEKRAAKRTRKEAKKAKKDKKKGKKEGKKRGSSSSSSGGSGSDSDAPRRLSPQEQRQAGAPAGHGLSPRRGLGARHLQQERDREHRRTASPPRRQRSRSRSAGQQGGSRSPLPAHGRSGARRSRSPQRRRRQQSRSASPPRRRRHDSRSPSPQRHRRRDSPPHRR